jgi:hypothetical protein
MRNIPLITRREIETETSGEAIIPFLTLSHPKIDGVIRIVSDYHDWIYDGFLFTGAGFEVSLVTNTDAQPSAKLKFPNSDPVKVFRLEYLTEPVLCRLDLISSVYFNTKVSPRIEKSGVTAVPGYVFEYFQLYDLTITQEFVEGTLRIRDYKIEQWPETRSTYSRLPGVWA